jgi:hypothetical protein
MISLLFKHRSCLQTFYSGDKKTSTRFPVVCKSILRSTPTGLKLARSGSPRTAYGVIDGKSLQDNNLWIDTKWERQTIKALRSIEASFSSFLNSGKERRYNVTPAAARLAQRIVWSYYSATQECQILSPSLGNSRTDSQRPKRVKFGDKTSKRETRGGITIKGSLIRTNTITVNFDNEQIDAMASILSEALGLRLSKSGNEYILR